jgi:glycosyltransferase involved in cell wall biosynthesis
MFTVLISIYDGERASHFTEAFESLASMRGLSSIDEVLLILDGPIREELQSAINSFEKKLPLRVVALKENAGLAEALNHGLALVKSPWIMRFDTDDVCLSHRLEKQIAIAQENQFDLFGAQIEEFDQVSNKPFQSRLVPLAHDEIVRYSLRRNPFLHMTVCFELARQAGGYPALPFMEDYALWVKMISLGARACNSPESLVRARIGAGMYQRRGGITYAKCEYKLQRYFVQIGHKSSIRAILDGLARGIIFISPIQIRRWVYENILRR